VLEYFTSSAISHNPLPYFSPQTLLLTVRGTNQNPYRGLETELFLTTFEKSIEGSSRKPNPCGKRRNHSNSSKLGKANTKLSQLAFSIRIVNTPTTHWWMVGVVVILAKNTRCKQWPRQNLNHDEYGGYYFCPPSLNPTTTWVRPGPELPPICLQIILASCLRARTQKFPEVRIKSLLSRLAFLVGIIFPAGSL